MYVLISLIHSKNIEIKMNSELQYNGIINSKPLPFKKCCQSCNTTLNPSNGQYCELSFSCKSTKLYIYLTQWLYLYYQIYMS